MPPKKLFLLDSLGGLLSAIMLGLVLTSMETAFGMPRKVLYPLAFIACAFSLYSFLCFWRFPEQWRPYLRLIAVANLSYGCLTLGLVMYWHQQLTPLGLLYFVLEMLVVTGLAVYEWRVAGHGGRATG